MYCARSWYRPASKPRTWLSVSSSWLNRKDVLVPPTLRTPFFFTADAHSLEAISSSEAVGPDWISLSNASLSIATAFLVSSAAGAAASVVFSVSAELPNAVNAERENAAAARTLTSFLLIDFAIFQILLLK